MLKKEIKGLFLPAAFLLIGIFSLLLSLVLDESQSEPSEVVVVLYFLLLANLLLWIPLGIIVLLMQRYRYRISSIDSAVVFYQASSGDQIRFVVGLSFLVFFALISFALSFDAIFAFVMFLYVCVFNAIPLALFIGLGWVFTLGRRRRITDAKMKI